MRPRLGTIACLPDAYSIPRSSSRPPPGLALPPGSGVCALLQKHLVAVGGAALFSRQYIRIDDGARSSVITCAGPRSSTS